MRLPGFTADLALAEAAHHYRQLRATSHLPLPVGMAADIDPYSLSPVDPCRRCNAMTGCAKSRCLCVCNDGYPIPNSRAHCGFQCT